MDNVENIDLQQKLQTLIERYSPVLTQSQSISDTQPLVNNLVQLVSEVSQIAENLEILLFLREQDHLDHETYELLFNRLKLKNELLIY